MVASAVGLLGCTLSSDPAPKNGKAEDSATPSETAKQDPVEPADAKAGAAGCTVSYSPEVVNGNSLWADVPNPGTIDNCNFHRLAYNNFLYLVRGKVPRFLTEMASTYGDLAETGTWPAKPQPLDTRGELQFKQAGDNLELIDVGGQTVVYDVRINKVMWDAIVANDWNRPLTAAAAAFNADPSKGGVWLPPNVGDAAIKNPSSESSVEIKTSWRKYGKAESDCPSAIMYCTKDSAGDWLGLLGFHLVQKTETHGEWLWATFEHVANAPDCNPTLGGGQATSNPLQQNPRDPTQPSSTINVNRGALAAKTGWVVFDYSSFKAGGGDGTSCDYTKGEMHNGAGPCKNPSGTAECNGNPQDPEDPERFVQINVCRTEPIPDHSTPAAIAAVCASADDPDESVMTRNNIACITQSVVDNWPADLDPRWKYYMLVGTEWAVPTSGTGTGAPTVGCFNVTNVADPRDDYTCPTAATFPSVKTSGSVSLANTTMETWMQNEACISYTTSAGTEQSIGTVDCLSCHQPPTLAPTNTSANNHADLSHAFSAFAGTPPT